MKVTHWGVSAVAALLLVGGSGFAGNNDEIGTMKATMESMKQEMEAMRATMATEREAIRASTGGAPESLKSASGKANVKIGGVFKVRYTAGLENGYGNNNNIAGGTGEWSNRQDNTRYNRTSWDMYKAEINFTIDFTADTMGYIALRPDRGSASVGDLLDEAWWQWSNIGGTGFSTKVGLQTLDIGMFNCDGNDPWDRVLIHDPFVKTAVRASGEPGGIFGFYENPAHDIDITALGISGAYTWDQFKVSAGIYGQRVAHNDGMSNTLGVTANGTARNVDIENHYITVHYDPCWLENLHLQASYWGEFDQGGGVEFPTWYPGDYTFYDRGGLSDYAWNSSNHGATYVPGFTAGASYIADCWAVYGEAAVIINPNYYKDSYQLVFSVGADYSITEKLKVGGGVNFQNYYGSHYWGSVHQMGDYGNNTLNAYALRASLAAKYDFGNGLYVQAEYFHEWRKAWGVNDSNCKDADVITFQTGFKF